MFRNILAAALRNLARNRLYAAISIGGLAIGMAAALLTFLFVRDELNFDGFIPGHERVFVLMHEVTAPGLGRERESASIAQQAAWLKLDLPQIVDAERIAFDSVVVRRGDVEANETVGWADPGLLRLLPYPALAGDPAAALEQPDAVVITRAMARKYFGQDRPIDQTLQFNRKQVFRVAAVIEDYPASANITAQIFASGRSPASSLSRVDAKPYNRGSFDNFVRTYVRLRDPRLLDAVNRALPAYVSRRLTPPDVLALFPAGVRLTLSLVPITRMHLMPDASASTPPSSPALLYGLGAIATLILGVAGVNFVNLVTARAARRAVEVGVRKATGAERGHLVTQFIGEALLYAVVATLCAMALVELMLPALNGLVLRHLAFTYWRDPPLQAFTLGLTLLMGLMAGAYPALVLSAFRPAAVLKGGLPQTGGSNLVRQGLVTLQFAVLILLLLGVLVIQRQTRFAMSEATGVDKQGLMRISVAPPCRGPFADAVAKLPGVRSVVCASGNATGAGENNLSTIAPGGRLVLLDTASIDFGFMQQLGLRPLAGRLPSPDRGEDSVPFDPARNGCFAFNSGKGSAYPASVFVNGTMVRAMGLSDPAQAIGASLRIHTGLQSVAAVRIAGVVPDFGFDLTHGPLKPTAYYVDPHCFYDLGVKIAPGHTLQTVTAIAGLWKQLGDPRPIRQRFIDDYLRTVVYAGVIRQGMILSALAGIAVFIGCLGMFALAAFTAERRTKEIGVRKAMGASSRDIVRLLLWSFTKPVLVANLIAWPLGWWVMDRWLQGFSARISLSPWLFLAAGGAALAIAAITVSAHTLRVASAKPVGALRYE